MRARICNCAIDSTTPLGSALVVDLWKDEHLDVTRGRPGERLPLRRRRAVAVRPPSIRTKADDAVARPSTRSDPSLRWRVACHHGII
jgi:hypothetical protein